MVGYALVVSTAVTIEAKYRRTWPQRFVLLVGLVLATSAAYAGTRLESVHNKFEEIVRVDVPFGVLAEPVEDGDPLNILIIGTDSASGLDPDSAVNIGREDVNQEPRADVIMVLRLDPRSGKASVVSIPRDVYLPISGTNAENKISSALLFGSFQEGITHVVETVQDQFEIEIHDFLIVDFLGFQELVDAIGGVPVWFDRATTDIGSGLNIQSAPACHNLDGSEALAYVRGRKFEEYDPALDQWVPAQRSDLFRVKRQQDFLILALERAIDKGARDLLFQNTLIEAGAKAVTLDDRFTIDQLLSLGQAFSDFNPDTLTRLPLDPYLSDDRVRSGGYDVDILRIDLEAAHDLFDVFRGFDTVRPSDVVVKISEGRMLREAEEVTVSGHLTNREFQIANVTELDERASETVVRFAEEHRDAADLIARFLTESPKFEIADDLDDGVTLELVVGDDYVGFRLFPLQTSDEFVDALNEVAPTTTRSEAEEKADEEAALNPTTTAAPTTVAAADDPEPDLATTTLPVVSTVTTTTVGVMGRAPDGVRCQ